ncbi:hypothetical protein BSBH6_02144 [Bacillus subtilis]|nr:hypothetical protein BSBH6_02144 [Bacillus subtilis]RPK25134.1 hypothetical protein BH5_01965 [Bacillus subtilis]
MQLVFQGNKDKNRTDRQEKAFAASILTPNLLRKKKRRNHFLRKGLVEQLECFY